MEINTNTGLVLEGGGMRGVFTAGVLDAFMKILPLFLNTQLQSLQEPAMVFRT